MLSEVAIAATDMAEVLGTAIGLCYSLTSLFLIIRPKYDHPWTSHDLGCHHHWI